MSGKEMRGGVSEQDCCPKYHSAFLDQFVKLSDENTAIGDFGNNPIVN